VGMTARLTARISEHRRSGKVFTHHRAIKCRLGTSPARTRAKASRPILRTLPKARNSRTPDSWANNYAIMVYKSDPKSDKVALALIETLEYLLQAAMARGERCAATALKSAIGIYGGHTLSREAHGFWLEEHRPGKITLSSQEFGSVSFFAPQYIPIADRLLAEAAATTAQAAPQRKTIIPPKQLALWT